LLLAAIVLLVGVFSWRASTTRNVISLREGSRPTPHYIPFDPRASHAPQEQREAAHPFPPASADLPRPGEEAPSLWAEQKSLATTPSDEGHRIKTGGQVLASLPQGKIVLNAPKNMKVGDSRAVYANVGVNVAIETLRKYSRTTDQSHESALRVSSQMAAVLTGPGFEIKSTTPEEQSVAEGFPTVWSWNVEAKQEGEQELEAILYVLIPAADKSSRQRIDSYIHKIGVSVKELTWGEWIKARKDEIDAVKAISVTLFTALTATLGWLGLSYRRRKKSEGPGHADPVT
jgi:hypothetical protein